MNSLGLIPGLLMGLWIRLSSPCMKSPRPGCKAGTFTPETCPFRNTAASCPQCAPVPDPETVETG